MKPKAIIGIVLIIIGILIFCFVSIGMIGLMAHDADSINDVFTESNSIVFGVIFGIPLIGCFLPGYYLVKSAKE